MNFRKLIVLLALIHICMMSDAQSDADILIYSYISKYQKFNSIDYGLTFKIKSVFNTEYSVVRTKCRLIRDQNDSILGGYFYINKGINDYYYLNGKLIEARSDDKNYLIESINDKDFNKTLGNIISFCFQIFFYNPEKIYDLVYESDGNLSVRDTVVNSIQSRVMDITLKDQPPTDKINYRFFISKADTILYRIESKIDVLGDFQHSIWEIDTIVFDKTTLQDLEHKLNAVLIEYKPLQPTTRPNIEKELPAETIEYLPHFEGEMFNNSKPFSIEELKGKLILIDFWYMSCAPCYKTIPYLRDFYNKYHSKGLEVIGLNPFDNSNSKKELLSIYIEKNGIDYPVILVNRSVADLFKVHAYPTMFLFDKSGNLIEYSKGYNPDEFKKWDIILYDILK